MAQPWMGILSIDYTAADYSADNMSGPTAGPVATLRTIFVFMQGLSCWN